MISKAKVMEIYASSDLSSFSGDEIAEAEQWVQDYALARFKKIIETMPEPVKVFVWDMVTDHFGSTDVDVMMIQLECYPDWIKQR